VQDRVFHVAVTKLATCPDTRSNVEDLIKRTNEPSHVEAALSSKEYALSPAGKALALDVIKHHLDDSRGPLATSWYEAVRLSLVALKKEDADSSYWERQYERLLIPSSNNSHDWAYRRAWLLEILAPK